MGYKQSPEHVAKRIKSGPEHYNWAGDAISVKGGRARALRLYEVGLCEACGAGKAERHHADGNTANNEPSNIQRLCRRCHMEADGRLEAFRADARRRAPGLIKAAAMARRGRTECKRGHSLVADNLYVTPQGKRVCKTCRRQHKQAHRSRGGR